MQTFALAVEAGARNRASKLELCELAAGGNEESSVWDIEVPLLSDSAELEEEEEEEIEGRTTSIRRVAERWFEFSELEGEGGQVEQESQGIIAEDVDMEGNDMMLV